MCRFRVERDIGNMNAICCMETNIFWRMPSSGMLLPCSVRRLLVTANAVRSSPILFILMMKALGSSKTPVHTRATRRNISEVDILHGHRCENLKSSMLSVYLTDKMMNVFI
jgi:hypothetical protein